jgi:prevent-host-death family protein
MKRTERYGASVPVGELKARLSEYLRLVKAGQDIVVTQRGRPVARIVPVTDTARAPGRLQRLVAEGLVREPRRNREPDFWERPRPRDASGRSLEILLEERAEGR